MQKPRRLYCLLWNWKQPHWTQQDVLELRSMWLCRRRWLRPWARWMTAQQQSNVPRPRMSSVLLWLGGIR